jgi:hypothetical protein
MASHALVVVEVASTEAVRFDGDTRETVFTHVLFVLCRAYPWGQE